MIGNNVDKANGETGVIHNQVYRPLGQHFQEPSDGIMSNELYQEIVPC